MTAPNPKLEAQIAHRKRLQRLDKLHTDVLARMHELAEQLLVLDRKYHARVLTLEQSGALQYHIDNDLPLRQLSGATKVVSDMLAGMSAYVVATRSG